MSENSLCSCEIVCSKAVPESIVIKNIVNRQRSIISVNCRARPHGDDTAADYLLCSSVDIYLYESGGVAVMLPINICVVTRTVGGEQIFTLCRFYFGRLYRMGMVAEDYVGTKASEEESIDD